MVNLLQTWAEQYKEVRPEVVVQVAGGGSGVGIAGLIDATLDIAAASRETLTATVAAELGEAVASGTHYRVLFALGALLMGISTCAARKTTCIPR